MGMIRENNKFSFSQLEQADRCPYSYYLERIERVDTAENFWAQSGTLVHELLCEWANGEIDIKDLPQAFEIRYPEAVTASCPPLLASRGYADKAYDQCLSYFQNFEGFPGLEVVSAEQPFTVRIDGRPFRGVIDLILRNPETDELIIVDHKSKSMTAFKKAQKTMWRQQYLYSLYVLEKYGRYPDTLAFNLFKEGLWVERPFDQKEFDETLAWATDMIHKMEEWDFTDWLVTMEKGGLFCHEICSVRHHCPNGIEED